MDPVDAAVANLLAAWQQLSSTIPGGAVQSDDGLLLCSTGSPLQYFNQAFVHGETDPVETLARSRDFFADNGGVPYVVRAPQDRFDALLDHASEFALQDGSGMPLMTMYPIGEPAPLPDAWRDSVEFQVVNDSDGLALHGDVLARGFAMPVDIVEPLLQPALVTSEWFWAVIAVVNGVAASTAALIEGGGVAGVYNVATDPEFRRQGIGEACTWAAVEEGRRRGFDIATLQASDMGYPIYERMGFRRVAVWRSLTSS